MKKLKIFEDFEKQDFNPNFDYDTPIIKQFNDIGFSNVKVNTSLANGLSQYVTLTVDVLNEGKTYAEMYCENGRTTITIRISDHDSGLEKNCNGISGNTMTMYAFKKLISTGAIKGSN